VPAEGDPGGDEPGQGVRRMSRETTLPDWAIRREARQYFENTYRVSRESLPVLMGFDAMRMCMGQEPATFTREGVLHWIDIVAAPFPRVRVA
jgi:hypothetical protein